MGNFSRDTFDRLKNYVGVRLQQGVPLVDADWNEEGDIRKYELQAYLRWYVGDGVPANNDGFLISSIAAVVDDFLINGGDGSPDGAGRCLVDGQDVVIHTNLEYSNQLLFENTDLAAAWGVDPLPALTIPAGLRNDVVYLDVWEREVNSIEDSDLINPVIGLETSVRLKREWVVRVVENDVAPPTAPVGHVHYVLAVLSRNGATLAISDLRETGINLVDIKNQVANLQDDVQAHLANTSNPHSVTAAQINALSLDEYDFRLRMAATVTFTQLDGNLATRTVTTGFRTQFIWVVGYCRSTLSGQEYGAHASAHADLRDSFIQRGIASEIYRLTTQPFLRQNTDVVNSLLQVKFRNETLVPIQDETIGISVSSATDTQVSFRLSRGIPGSSGTSTGATGTGTGTGTGGPSIVALPNFQARLFVLCFG